MWDSICGYLDVHTVVGGVGTVKPLWSALPYVTGNPYATRAIAPHTKGAPLWTGATVQPASL